MGSSASLEHRSLLRQLFRLRAIGTLADDEEESLTERMAALWTDLTGEEQLAVDHMTATLNALGPAAFGVENRPLEDVHGAHRAVAVQGPFLAEGCGARLLIFERSDDGKRLIRDPWTPQEPVELAEGFGEGAPAERLLRLAPSIPVAPPVGGWVALELGVDLLGMLGPASSGELPLAEGVAGRQLVQRQQALIELRQWVSRLMDAARRECDNGRMRSIVRALWNSPVLDRTSGADLCRVLREPRWKEIEGAELLLADLEDVVAQGVEPQQQAEGHGCAGERTAAGQVRAAMRKAQLAGLNGSPMWRDAA